MATIKIEALQFRLTSGEQAFVSGLNLSSTHALEGYVHFEAGEEEFVSWDLDGNPSNKDEAFQLSPQSVDGAEFQDLKETAIHLAPGRIRQQLGYA